MAALVGCQFAEFVQKTYFIANVQLWSDSEIVLYWIRNLTQKQGVFVSNRLNAINGYGFPFRHVPTKDNPADLPSRGVDSLSRTCKIWWEGPTWLCRSENHWPSDVITKPGLTVQTRLLPLSDPHRNLFHPQYSGDTICHVSEEPRNQGKDALSQTSLVTKASVQVEQSPFSINVQRFSSLSKLFRVTALCARFIQRLQKKASSTGPVTVEELITAKSMWIQSVQNERFGDQLRQLKRKKSDSILRSMSLVLDDEFLKCHGRLAYSMVPVDTNMPISLPPKNRFTDLVIQDQHEKLYHSGVRHTLSALRQAYWIPTGRQQVRYVLRKCRICRLWEGGAYSNPPPPPLPSRRVAKSPAFTFTGCDFAGPLLVFNGQDSSMFYICLFICAVTRAVYLELVEDMTTHCFLMALRRFISRRGCPQEIISDNAKTFKLSNQISRHLVISDETLNFVSNQGIKWKFNVERAPWWGGFFEKMVSLTKKTLIKAIGKTKLNAVELSTVLTEVEADLNSRPLTYLYNDLPNGQPLSPANFLSEATSFGLPQSTPDVDPEYMDPLASTTELVNKLRAKQHTLDRFWKLWLNDYLPSLREFHHYKQKTSRNNPYMPHVGNVVLVKQEGSKKRDHWKLGIIHQLYPGKDSQVRSVQVRCKGGMYLQRPISLVYPLEIESCEPTVNTSSDVTIEPKQRRKAAVKAEERMKNIFSDIDVVNT